MHQKYQRFCLKKASYAMFIRQSAEVSVVWRNSLNILLMTTDTQCRWGIGGQHHSKV